MSTAKEWKDKGNSLVKEKKYKEALDCYSKAIELDPNDPILYSNRSAMHLNLSEFDEAINDAEKAISLKPDYAKAYLRKGKALEGQQRIQEALDTYKLGLEKDKTNAQLLEASQELEASMNNPFMKNYPKLFTDPRTAPLMQDPQFRNLIDYAMKDQKILMQMIQTDPRTAPLMQDLQFRNLIDYAMKDQKILMQMIQTDQSIQKKGKKRKKKRKRKKKKKRRKKKKKKRKKKKKKNIIQ